ncbi:MAG: hypothetical protein Kow0076_7630 [Francisella sp.]
MTENIDNLQNPHKLYEQLIANHQIDNLTRDNIEKIVGKINLKGTAPLHFRNLRRIFNNEPVISEDEWLVFMYALYNRFYKNLINPGNESNRRHKIIDELFVRI